MFPDCKVTEIFFMCDEFSKIFDEIVSEFLLTEGQSKKKRKYHRDVLSAIIKLSDLIWGNQVGILVLMGYFVTLQG